MAQLWLWLCSFAVVSRLQFCLEVYKHRDGHKNIELIRLGLFSEFSVGDCEW